MKVHIRTIFFILLICFLTGCSESLPKISQVSSSVVFEFNDYESKPTVRLSAYASSENEVQRISEVRYISVSTGYEWTCKNVRCIPGKKYTWAGYSNIVPPQGEKLPLGRYELYFEDYAGNEVQAVFHVNYPEEYYDAKADDFPGIVKMPLTKFVALYDKDDREVYYGEDAVSKVSNILSNTDVADNFNELDLFSREHKKYRFVYQVNGGNIMVLMPVGELPENPNGEKELETEDEERHAEH